jgi:hypothetical protein
MEFEISEFNPKKAELTRLGEQYKDLVISWPEDKKWYELVHKARMELVKTRTDIEKKWKELRDPHTQFNKKVSELEKELISLIEPIEKELKDKQDAIDTEKKWIKEKEEANKRIKFQDRIDKLKAVDCIYPMAFLLQEMTDEEFEWILLTETNNFNTKLAKQIEIQWYIDLVNNCTNITDLLLLSIPEEFLEFTTPVYEIKKERLEFEEAQNKLKKEQEEFNKIKEAEHYNQTIQYKISNIDNIIDLEKYKLEIDDELFDVDFNKQLHEIENREELKQLEIQRKQEQEKKEQEEKKRKTKAYQDFCIANWMTADNKLDFKTDNTGTQIILWKKVWTFNL